MKKFIIALLIVAVLLISGCAGQQSSSPGTQATVQKTSQAPQEPVKTLGQQTQQLAPGEEYFGKADSYVISVKQFSGKADNIAVGRYSDACAISILGEAVSNKELGKAQTWSYKYYSKSQNKALTVAIATKLRASGVDIYAKTTDNVVVFKDEPYKKCITLANDVDSTEAAKAVSSSFAAIDIENDVTSGKDIYTFTAANGATATKVDATTGTVLV